MRRGLLEALSARVQAYRFGPYLFALAMVALAWFARSAFGWIGATLVYATYYPAILFTAFIAGPAAAVAAAAVSAGLAWWSFRQLPNGPTAANIANLTVFLISAATIVWLARLYTRTVARLRAEERQRELMLKEMEHRGKNTFAVVEVIVRNTLGATEQADTIVGRVRSVSSTNDIINRSPTHRASLRSIVANEFDPYGPARVRCIGDDIELAAHVGRHMALVVHELVTNAVKHGSLSAPDGIVEIQWTSDGTMVTMRWTERNGPAAKPPETYGFGARLITRTLRSLGGDIVADFRREGLACVITFKQA